MYWLFIFLFSFSAFTQKTSFSLPDKLDELSGIAFLNDSIVIAHNDGGDEPRLYFLSKTGKLIHTCLIQNAKNVDWEGLCFDGQKYLYIGDFGNNNNQRKDLTIYKVDAHLAFQSDVAPAIAYNFSYPDQKEFPAKDPEKHYDAEALGYYKGKLYVFTKCRAEPWDGLSFVYQLSFEETKLSVKQLQPLYIGPSGWWQDAVTDVAIQDDICYVLTYNRLMAFKIAEGKLKFIGRIYLEPITQKEAVAVNKKGHIVVGDERSKMLGGGFLTHIENKWIK